MDTKLIIQRKKAAEDYLVQKRKLWDEYEDIFFGRLQDKQSNTTKSQVFDHKLSTMVMDRAARVMAQMQVGKVKAISKNDEGASRLMNLTLEKYVYPNAKAQFDFLIKARMVDQYSNIYGSFPVMVDWDVRDDGYSGPDMWLIPIRDFFPQVGAVSLHDSDYVIVRTWQPLSWFESLKGKKEFMNASEIYQKLKDKAGDKQGRNQGTDTSERENAQYPSTANPAKGKGYYEVLSMYERDKWTDYVPSADMILRERKNPHNNGELPVVMKYSIPLIDDFMGMGDFERGKTMQYTVNSLWNMYLDAVKVSLFPPVLLNANGIADQSSIKWGAAAKWLMNGPVQGQAQMLPLSPQGTSTFNNVYQVVTSSMLNMFGTTDTATSERVDPGFGKTPQALKMQASRENARDNVDRFYMEQFLTEVGRKFVNLLSTKQAGDIQIRMFQDEIEELSKVYPEISEMYDEKKGKLNIKKAKMGSIKYDYEIIPGSTYQVDQAEQQQNLMSLLGLLTQNMQVGQQGVTSPMIEALKQEGKTVKLGEFITRITANSGITDWDTIIVDENSEQGDVMSQMDQLSQILQGGVNGIPPQPQGMQEMPQMEQQMPQMQGMNEQY